MVLGTLLWIIVIIVVIIVIVALLKFLFQLFFVIPVGTDSSTDLQYAKEILLPMPVRYRNSIAYEVVYCIRYVFQAI